MINYILTLKILSAILAVALVMIIALIIFIIKYKDKPVTKITDETTNMIEVTYNGIKLYINAKVYDVNEYAKIYNAADYNSLMRAICDALYYAAITTAEEIDKE